MNQPPARRILIHAGFHKTGTTTVQDMLRLNARALLPDVEMYLQESPLITSMTRAVLDFSGNRCKATKTVISEQAELFFSLIDMSDPRPVLVSSESLSGHFPGSSGVAKYAPAPIAMELIRNAWTRVAGAPDGFEVYYSTRRDGWLKSCHWQRLKTNRSTLSLEEYEAKFAEAADHPAIIEDLRVRLGAAAVHSAAIEDLDHPIDPILAILGLSDRRGSLQSLQNANVSPSDETRQKLLELNRSKIWGDAFQKKKFALLRET